MHAEQAARGAQHEIAERVPVGVVVELEPIVVDEFDAEAVAAMLLAQRGQQALFAHLAAIEQRAAVAAHPAQQRLALFQLHAFLPQLFEDVQKYLVPVLDLVADGELERLEARADQIHLGGAELQHPGDIVEQVADRPGELGLGGDHLVRHRFSSAKKRQFLRHVGSVRRRSEQVRYQSGLAA